MDERKKELMKDLDSYLSTRLKKNKSNDDSFYSFKKKKVEVVAPEPEVSPGAEVMEEYEDQGPGFLKGLWYSIVGEREDQPSESQVEELKDEVQDVKSEELHVKDDLKSLAKISLEILRHSQGTWLKDFKQTDDFSKFKDILRRHQLIK